MRLFRNGLTLIEVLIVIAIIGVLAAILFPLFSIARGKAQGMKCVSNQHQIAQAALIWAQDNGGSSPRPPPSGKASTWINRCTAVPR